MSLPVEKRRQWIKSRREQRKLTKYARLRRQFLRYLSLLCLLSTGVFIFYRIHCHLYDNKDGLVIRGNFIVSNEQIFNVLKSELSTPLFLLNPNDLENRIQTLHAIKHAFVRRYVLPKPLLKIEILEEFPWATVYCFEPDLAGEKSQRGLKAQLVIAESGKLISTAEFPNVYQPSLKIYIEDSSHLRLNQNDIQQWADRLSYINQQMQCPVKALDMREPHNVKVETSKFTLVLGNPDSGLPRRLSRLASVLEVLANQDREPVCINLGLNSNVPVKLAKKLDKGASETKMSSL